MIAPVIIESLDQEGRGVAHVDGKAIFIEGALPGELVTYSPYRKKQSFELAQVAQILKPAFGRVRSAMRVFWDVRGVQHAALGCSRPGCGETACHGR